MYKNRAFDLELKTPNILPTETSTPTRTTLKRDCKHPFSMHHNDINTKLSYAELWKMSCMLHSEAGRRQ